MVAEGLDTADRDHPGGARSIVLARSKEGGLREPSRAEIRQTLPVLGLAGGAPQRLAIEVHTRGTGVRVMVAAVLAALAAHRLAREPDTLSEGGGRAALF